MELTILDEYVYEDHKQNFENNKQDKLINPTETELGLVF